jgi:hypothetical protein
MPGKRIIDTNRYYNSNHWDFKCIDCHSDEYYKAPHDTTLKNSKLNTCLDCHADDENTAKYHFDKIESAFHKSIHYRKDSVIFSCWSCHDAHYNKAHERNTEEGILKTVSYDNEMCMHCHNDPGYFTSINKQCKDINEMHEWLPYMENHFKNVRCIDCHAEIDDTILVDHNIQPKANSVRECAVCHSTNSILLKTLYERRPIKNVNKYGFFNYILMNEQYVIGANRNYILNILSIILFGFVVFVIFLHIVVRLVQTKSKKK